MQSVFLVGSGCGGAGVVAGLFARSGLSNGAELRPVTSPGGLGAFEAAGVVEANEALLSAVVPAEELLFDGQRWLARLNPDVEIPSCREIDEAIRGLVQRPFCLKDPRFVWTLPRWRDQVQDAGAVCVFRSPAATATSMLEACGATGSLARTAMDLERAFDVWTAVYRRVLRTLRAAGEWHFIHLDQVFSADSLDALEAFAGVELNREFVVPELRRDEPLVEVPAEAMQIYAELCELAGYRPSTTHPARPTAEIAVVVPVRDHERSWIPQLLTGLAAQRNVCCDVVLVDQTTDGDLKPEAVDGASNVRIVREPSPSRAAAYQRALSVTDAAYIAWQDPASGAFPQRLARHLSVLRNRPEVDFSTSDLLLREADGNPGRRIAVDLCGDAPPAFWQSGVVLRREVLAEMDSTCFAPTELGLYRKLRDAGRVSHLAEALVEVDTDVFEGRQPWAGQDVELLRLADARALEQPQVTVLMACHDRKDALIECLEGFSRQLVSPGTLEIIVIDDGSTDGTAQLVSDLRLPVAFRFMEQENSGAGSARNTGLPHARGQFVLFVNDDTIPFPDTVQRHIEAHRELSDRRAVVLGTFEQPADECDKNLTRLFEHSNFGFSYSEFERERDLAGSYFYTCNVSVPIQAVREVGGFDEAFPCYAEDTDYGVRLEALGYRIHYRPEARAIHRHVLRTDTIRWRQRAVASAHVRLFSKHPSLLYRAWDVLTAPKLEAVRAKACQLVPRFERALDTLSSINLGAMEQLGGDHAQLAEQLAQRLEGVFKELNGAWWAEGFLDGFREAEVSGFPEALAGRPVALPGVDSFVLLSAHGDEQPRWLAAAEAWLAGCRGSQAVPEDTALVVVAGPDGPGLDEIRSALGGVSARVRRAGQPARALVVDCSLPGAQRARLFGSACGWIPSGSASDSADRELAGFASTPELQLDARAVAVETVPWPLTTLLPVRIIAWPQWESPDALRDLVAAMAPLVGRADTCVILRHDTARDGDAGDALGALKAAAHERYGPGRRLDVLLEPSPDQPGFWTRIGHAADAVLCPREGACERGARLSKLGLPVLTDASGLEEWLVARLSSSPDRVTQIQKTEELVHA